MVKPNNNEDSYLIDDMIVKVEKQSGGVSRRTFVKGSAALAAVLALGGSMGMYAWFTDSEGKKNKTTIAQNLDVEVVEPSFPAEGVTDVQPGQTIPKDPAVKNNSDTLTGWLFTEIRVPMAAVVVEGAEAAEKLPLFTFTSNAGWKQLQEFEDGDTKVYRFGWETTVAPGGNQTGNIFDEVTFVNLDGSAQGLALSEQLVKVIGYGIQDAEQFEGDVAKAWNAYKLQNGIKDGEGNTIAAALIAGAAGNKLQFVQGTPKVGDMLDAGEVIEVVEDVEHLPVQEVSPLVSEENRSSVLTVEDVVPTKPENTVNWFKDMDYVQTMDLSGLDTTAVVSTDGMFEGTYRLAEVVGYEDVPAEVVEFDYSIYMHEEGFFELQVKRTTGAERWFELRFDVFDENGDCIGNHLTPSFPATREGSYLWNGPSDYAGKPGELRSSTAGYAFPVQLNNYVDNNGKVMYWFRPDIASVFCSVYVWADDKRNELVRIIDVPVTDFVVRSMAARSKDGALSNPDGYCNISVVVHHEKNVYEGHLAGYELRVSDCAWLFDSASVSFKAGKYSFDNYRIQSGFDGYVVKNQSGTARRLRFLDSRLSGLGISLTEANATKWDDYESFLTTNFLSSDRLMWDTQFDIKNVCEWTAHTWRWYCSEDDMNRIAAALGYESADALVFAMEQNDMLPTEQQIHLTAVWTDNDECVAEAKTTKYVYQGYDYWAQQSV